MKKSFFCVVFLALVGGTAIAEEGATSICLSPGFETPSSTPLYEYVIAENAVTFYAERNPVAFPKFQSTTVKTTGAIVFRQTIANIALEAMRHNTAIRIIWSEGGGAPNTKKINSITPLPWSSCETKS